MNLPPQPGARVSRRVFVVWSGLVLAVAGPAAAAEAQAAAELNWYKGNIHCHTFWSDGDQFPDMVADWYKSHGYHFLAISDHNVLLRGERLKELEHPKHPVPAAVLRGYIDRFGEDWVEVRDRDTNPRVRLKTLEEIRGRLEEPGRFLLIENEEITGKHKAKEVHLNALNVAELVLPQEGQSVRDTLGRDVEVIQQQAARLNRKILIEVNHPHWRHFDVPAEDIAAVEGLRLLEFMNNSPGTNNAGDRHHPSCERLWDVANTIRLGEMKQPPLWGTASDDAHKYHLFRPGQGNPGRGWIMVRAAELSTDALLDAIDRGDFYCSTGVTLRDLDYDEAAGTLTVEVDARPGVDYQIEIRGTPVDYDRTVTTRHAPAVGRFPAHPVRHYSADVGRLLASGPGPRLTYRLAGNELYVRAVIRSNRPMANPPEPNGMNEAAWTQPVGWHKRLTAKP